jgi:hypothetical protein
MCSPKVAQIVRERIQKEGLPNLSRRSFLRLGGISATSAAVASVLGGAAGSGRYGRGH